MGPLPSSSVGLAGFSGAVTGGVGAVIGHAAHAGKLEFFPSATLHAWIPFIGAWVQLKQLPHDAETERPDHERGDPSYRPTHRADAAARLSGWTWNGVPFTQSRRACQ